MNYELLLKTLGGVVIAAAVLFIVCHHWEAIVAALAAIGFCFCGYLAQLWIRRRKR